MSFLAGQVVGDYEIVRPLGQGGIGAVFEATHRISRRADALKILHSEQTGTPERAERFRREIQVLATLNHPNIAGLHNAFYLQDQLVMVMELVEGEDLRSLGRRTRLGLPQLLDYAAQALTGLVYAHSRGVVHRDIKPANIMVSPSGTVKLLDFGIAVTERSTELTKAGSLVGSPTYMSPEQIRGEKTTPQTDIYSLAVTLYELIAGRPPFEGATYQLLMAHLHQAPTPLAELRADLPVSLSEVIAKAMEKDPGHRFAHAGEFLAALQAVSGPVLSQTFAIPSAMPPAGRTSGTGSGSGTHARAVPDVAQLEVLERHLAAYIGPIAKIVVGRLARQTFDLDRLYKQASEQIDSEADRAKFLRTRPR